MSADRKYEPPETSVGDHSHALARAGLGSIPMVGNAAVELFGALIMPPLQKRQREWMEAVGAGLRTLEAKGVSLDGLRDNPEFVDTVLQASQAAMRTSQQEKREALRNAVLNSAMPHSPDESKRHLFVNWLDTLTVWHLRTLRLFDDPLRWFQDNGKQPIQFHITGSMERLLTHAFPELANQREFRDKLYADLKTEGLLRGRHRPLCNSI